MAFPQKVTSYPDWFMDVARRIEDGTERIILAYPTPQDAMRVRQQFHGFLGAMERAGMFPMYPRFQTMRLAIRGNDLHIMTANEFLPKPSGA